ncbi:PREDICTED: uncharacterized protein LOC105140029 [Populus euphratica]|uniref:Uncharacterized protein LOC105140029 n=1 Tax=Populus euphratica TaxID=75702 RepID=A0AAJ6VB65_POPEU|nr:PREDICTED: uncharacterized protein LOC105140029 [Populus euphratica]
MEVLVGPTFSIGGDVSSTGSTYVVAPPPQEKHQVGVAPPFLFLKDGDGDESPISSRAGSGSHPDDLSDSSSSIGAPDDSDEDEEDGVVSSNNALDSLNSMEDALPIKRGLSNHFTGKSKSFTNLAEVNTVNTVKELEKPENPFNKRRRILMANKWSRKSFYSWSNPKSMPLLTMHEEEDDDDEDPNKGLGGAQDEDSEENPSLTQGIIARKLQEKRLNKFGLKSQSCFSLSDLQEEEEEDNDDENDQ